jgi:mono/diheme cytochrome c family protein
MRAALVAALLATACGREKTPVERGASAFQRTCASCHGSDGRGTRPPGFKTPPRDLTDPELQERLSDAMMKETIRFGKGQMPNFGVALPARDVDDLVAYLRTLRRAPR